jgi:hypothetical protein
MIRFSHSEYQPGESGDYALAQNYAYGVAGGLSAACALSSRLRLTVSTDDVAFRLRPAAVYWVIASVQHEFTIGAAVSLLVL